MITGIFGLLFFFPAIADIILGHMSRSEIRNSNGCLKGNGMATAGLVMGYGMIAMIPFILIIAAIAIRLASLGGNGASAPSADRAQLIDDRLAGGQKYGYQFALENCVNTETDHKYQVVAFPLARNQTGVRTFCSDESGVVKVGEGESAEGCLASGSPL